MNVADADITNIGESSGENTTTTVHTIALDSFFDFEVCSKTCIYSNFTSIWVVFIFTQQHDVIEDGGAVMAKSFDGKVDGRIREYMSLPMTNWRVNDVMEWWSDNFLTLLNWLANIWLYLRPVLLQRESSPR